MNKRNTKHIVAYLDMLGGMSRIEQDQNGSLNAVYHLYEQTMLTANKNCKLGSSNGIKIKIFSDNIVVAKELSPDESQCITDMRDVLWWCALFINTSVSKDFGWLFRGGISIGYFFMDDMMVWGEALIKAYEVEKNIAIYPRVVIDPKVIPMFELQSNKKTKELLMLDSDGIYSLNHMNMWPLTGKAMHEGFDVIKSQAKNKNGLYDDKIYQKLSWYMNYVNNELEKQGFDSERRSL